MKACCCCFSMWRFIFSQISSESFFAISGFCALDNSCATCLACNKPLILPGFFCIHAFQYASASSSFDDTHLMNSSSSKKENMFSSKFSTTVGYGKKSNPNNQVDQNEFLYS